MKIEIWSDVMCPFCYIGKRRFEKALLNFYHQNDIQVIWKSFLLQPNIKFDAAKNIYTFLSESKGMSLDQAKSMTQNVKRMAGVEGLNFDFDNLKVANSFDAHRLIHLAATYNLQDKAAEKLFSAQFIHGINVQDHQTLIKSGSEIGIEKQRVKKMLESDEFKKEVYFDVQEAKSLGIQGVPFFVFDRKYAVSGAQPQELFLEVLTKVREEESLAERQ